jgi:hypothetical protein
VLQYAPRKLGRLVAAVAVCLLAPTSHAAELQTDTAAAFDRYIHATEARLARTRSARDGAFLFIDTRSENSRAEAYAAVRQGGILIEQVNAKEEGRPIEVPRGLIHDWVGLLFIPGATLERTLAVVQDYNNQQDIYTPEVRRSKLLKHQGDHYEVYLQLYKKTVLTVVMNANFDIRHERLAASRAVSRAYSTRLAEVADFDEPGEHELPVDGGHGFLWRLYSYWWFEERDGGVYVQLESIGLSRSVPAIVAWLVNPLLRSIPRGTLENLLTKTRTAVMAEKAIVMARP